MKDIVRLVQLFKPYIRWMGAGAAIALVAILANVMLLGISGWFITAMGLAGLSGVAINYFTPAALIRACAIVRTGGRYVERLVTHEATFRLIAALRRWFFEKLDRLDIAALGFARSGDIVGRMHGDIDTLERFYLGLFVPAAVALCGSIILIAALWFYSPILAVFVLGALTFAGVVVPLLAFYSGRPHENTEVDTQAQMRAHLAAGLQGMGELLVYDQDTGHHEKEFDRHRSALRTSAVSLSYQNAMAANVPVFLGQLILPAALALAFLALGQEKITAPDFVLLALLVLAGFEIVMPLPAAFQKLGGVLRAARRIFSMTDHAPDISCPAKIRPASSGGDVCFERVTFSYPGREEPVLNSLSFTLKQGQKMAIVGPTGSGKTSIVDLLLGFYTPQGGTITLNNEKIQSCDAEALRGYFAVLEQNPYIFHATVRENLMLAKPDATQQDLMTACAKAGLHDFISALPDGYDTWLGEHGRALSGGQVRRLALARVLLKKSPCIILDEPGEGLDYTMEQDILSRVIETLDGVSLILISHRRGGREKMDKTLDLGA